VRRARRARGRDGSSRIEKKAARARSAHRGCSDAVATVRPHSRGSGSPAIPPPPQGSRAWASRSTWERSRLLRSSLQRVPWEPRRERSAQRSSRRRRAPFPLRDAPTQRARRPSTAAPLPRRPRSTAPSRQAWQLACLQLHLRPPRGPPAPRPAPRPRPGSRTRGKLVPGGAPATASAGRRSPAGPRSA
jgi:hypothetical protein